MTIYARGEVTRIAMPGDHVAVSGVSPCVCVCVCVCVSNVVENWIFSN